MYLLAYHPSFLHLPAVSHMQKLKKNAMRRCLARFYYFIKKTSNTEGPATSNPEHLSLGLPFFFYVL